MSALLLMLALTPARAAGLEGVRLWSWTGLELRPDHRGDTELRVEEQVAGDVAVADGWRVQALASVRDPAAIEAPVTGDLYRLLVRHDGGPVRLELGRLVRHGVQGSEHLDGASVELRPDAPLSARAWMGRQWHPETWTPGDVWALGGELSLHSTRRLRSVATAGWEGHLIEGAPAHRLFTAWGARGVKGQRLAASAEVQPAGPGALELGSRASVRGVLPVGPVVELGATARWEDLAPVASPVAMDGPLQWLAADGYAVGALDAAAHRGRLRAWASGGPVLRPGSADAAPGALVKGGAAVDLGSGPAPVVDVGLSGVFASTGESRATGGVVQAGLHPADWRLLAQAGLFRFEPLAGPWTWVEEGRLLVEAPLSRNPATPVRLRGELAGGADRALDPWIRGGAVLAVGLGGLQGGLP